VDIILARTFLEVVASGSFVTAAQRLHVTQSTVSTRIRSLEDALGQALFERSKAGAALTPAGEQFQRYAATLVRVWQQARHNIAPPPGYRSVLSIGGQISLWDQLLLDWLSWMNTRAPHIAVRAERGSSQTMIDHLIEGTLDIGVMYTPQQRPGLSVRRLFESELILVSTEQTPAKITPDNYVYVDWGPEFQAYHSAAHSEFSNPKLYVDSSFIGLQYILNNGGAGYFPERIVRAHLDDKQLFRVTAGNSFSLPVYVVHSTDIDQEIFGVVMRGLRQLARNK